MRKNKLAVLAVVSAVSMSVLAGCSIREFDPTVFMAQQSETKSSDEQSESMTDGDEDVTGNTEQIIGHDKENGLACITIVKTSELSDDVIHLSGVSDIANIAVQNGLDNSRQDSSAGYMLAAAKNISNAVNADNTDGVVVVCDSVSLEEMAYFVDLTDKSDKPVVFVSAESALESSVDAQSNLYHAVVVAMNEESIGRGVLVAHKGRIYEAEAFDEQLLYVIDTAEEVIYGDGETTYNITELPESGSEKAVGYIEDGKVVYTSDIIRKNSDEEKFDIADVKSLPLVTIIYDSMAIDTGLLENAFAGYDGIVIAAAGNGTFSKNTADFITESSRMPAIVRASRNADCKVVRDKEFSDSENQTIAAGTLSATKSRVLLMLSLTKTDDLKEIQQKFDLMQ